MGKKQSKISSEDIEDLVERTHCKTLDNLLWFYVLLVTAKELQKWYQGFLKDCPKGVLEKQV